MTSPPFDVGGTIAALLRHGVDALDTKDALASIDVDALFARAHEQGVLPLIADRLLAARSLAASVRQRCHAELQRATALDLALEAELRRLLATFAERRIDVLVIKGSQLAYSHYRRSELRTRVDADLLIRRERRNDAAQLLQQFGYVAVDKVTGELSATQQVFAREAPGELRSYVDLHWRWTSPPTFANVLTFDELYSRSVPIAQLGASARGPSPVHALTIACVHRVAHHHDDGDQLKWLYDIHLIADRLGTPAWDEFVRLTADRHITAVCLDGLDRASRVLGTVVPPTLSSVSRKRMSRKTEATAAYLDARWPAHVVLADLRSLQWRDRLRLTREHVLPSAEYMTNSYAPQSRLPLSALYLLRMVRGARTWLQRRPRRHEDGFNPSAAPSQPDDPANRAR